jgi:CDP-6-deoxy-D-xylo-4-hexulose-3-dehydrase
VEIKLALDTIDDTDIKELARWLLQTPTPKLTKGELTVLYEEEYAKENDRKYSVLVNSGSSANLLMVDALIKTNRLKNKKIVVPAISWITTISPLFQLGLKPILCDINLQTLSVDLTHLERIFIEEKPSALILVSVLGIPPQMDEINKLCIKHNVIKLMDNCESEGSSYKNVSIEKFGLMSTCSKYYGHITSCVEGGNICTDDKEIYDMLKMLRSHGWDRDLDEPTKKKLREKHSVSEFDAMYTFYETGYNLRSTDINAFLALRQLKKRNEFAKKRFENFNKYQKYLKSDLFRLEIGKNSFVSNLGFPIIHPNRDEIVKRLIANKIEVRPLISGSMGTQPYWVKYYERQILVNANICTKWGFYVPNYPSLTDRQIYKVCSIVNQCV